jgi:hypothetical protein
MHAIGGIHWGIDMHRHRPSRTRHRRAHGLHRDPSIMVLFVWLRQAPSWREGHFHSHDSTGLNPTGIAAEHSRQTQLLLQPINQLCRIVRIDALCCGRLLAKGVPRLPRVRRRQHGLHPAHIANTQLEGGRVDYKLREMLN